jgi:chemotaxis signal transduction protein
MTGINEPITPSQLHLFDEVKLEPVSTQNFSKSCQFIAIELGDNTYAIETSSIDSIAPYKQPHPVAFLMNSRIDGFLSYRGVPVPHVFLSQIQDGTAQADKLTRTIYFSYKGAISALSVTKVLGTIELPVPAPGGAELTTYGALKRLSIAKILGDEV